MEKPWQRGYTLDKLLALETRYLNYNAHARSPFSAMKKNRVADCLSRGVLKLGKTWAYVSETAKTKTTLRHFPNLPFGVRQRDDLTLSYLAVDWREAEWGAEWARLLADVSAPIWVRIWADDHPASKALIESGFRRIGTKVTSFGEVFAWYLRASDSEFAQRVLEISAVHFHGVSRVMLPNTSEQSVTRLAAEVDRLDLSFANHYSRYNVAASWSALSVRGYSSDIRMIEKPDAMNDAWRKKHAADVFALQDTELRAQLPSIEPLLEMFGEDAKWDRIRLMRLSPEGGELDRHTDQVDPTLGVGVGDLMRIHIPLKTNPEVIFTVWNQDGQPVQQHMGLGKIWALDVRWPHRAQNNGADERIHLVLDVTVDSGIQDCLKPAAGTV